MRWHPDKNGNSKESNDRFKEIAEAYTILSNPERRKHFDRFGRAFDEEDEGESSFFKEFEEMLNSRRHDCFFEDIEELTRLMESDTEYLM